MKRAKLYWLLQLGGWVTWSLNEALLYTNQYGWKWAWAISSIINIFVAIFLTHQYKKISHHFHWHDLNLYKMLQWHFISLLIMSACMAGLNIPFDYIFLQESFEVELSPFIVLQIIFNFMKPIAIWQLIYFFFQYSNKKLEMERENDQLERTIQETEGKVLRAQMNPHFVFNALNSIRALITEDPQKAKKGINQLSKLLRSSLLTERKKTIPLSEEMETVTDYLALEKIRYEERLEWDFQIEQICFKAQIPPMILQTLVENAIKHGISKSVKGGTITIKAQHQNQMLMIEVENPGHLTTKNTNLLGVGLINSQNRLRILFGTTAQLSLSPLNKNQVQAKLILPYLEE